RGPDGPPPQRLEGAVGLRPVAVERRIVGRTCRRRGGPLGRDLGRERGRQERRGRGAVQAVPVARGDETGQ
ncbi:MAG: hypothetical protein ACK55I_46595, partial [bacterium]